MLGSVPDPVRTLSKCLAEHPDHQASQNRRHDHGAGGGPDVDVPPLGLVPVFAADEPDEAKSVPDTPASPAASMPAKTSAADRVPVIRNRLPLSSESPP